MDGQRANTADLKRVYASPFWFKYFSFLGAEMAMTIPPFIFFPKSDYQNLKSKNPNANTMAVLLHEKIHVERAKEIGIIRWLFQYIFNKHFRLEEELTAIAWEIHQRHVLSADEYDVDRKARQFASSAYGNICKEDRARSLLQQLKEFVTKNHKSKALDLSDYEYFVRAELLSKIDSEAKHLAF